MERTTAVYLGRNKAILKTILGQKMYVDTRDKGIVPHLLLDGYWESWISSVMRAYLRNSVFFDVGANFGWYTLLAAHEGARAIFAFEPNFQIYGSLKDTCEVNGLVDCLVTYSAVGENQGTVRFSFDQSYLGNGSCGEDDGEEVPMTNLDTFSHYWHREALQEHPVTLKVDVEGFEPRVILGAKKLLESRRCTAFVEYHADPSYSKKLQDMLRLLETLGYQMSHIQQQGSVQRISEEQLVNIPDADMLLFQKF
jgi:FkbM family methyltransferase